MWIFHLVHFAGRTTSTYNGFVVSRLDISFTRFIKKLPLVDLLAITVVKYVDLLNGNEWCTVYITLLSGAHSKNTIYWLASNICWRKRFMEFGYIGIPSFHFLRKRALHPSLTTSQITSRIFPEGIGVVWNVESFRSTVTVKTCLRWVLM